MRLGGVAVIRISKELELPLEVVTETLGIVAQRGSGKTYLTRVLLEELVGAGLPAVVVDPMGVYWGARSSADGASDGLPIVVFGGDHGDVPLEPTAGTVIADWVTSARRSCILDLSTFRKGEQRRFVQDFAERLYQKNREPLHLILDEADLWAPQRPGPEQARLLGAIEDLVRRGRARGIGLSLVTQRPAVINKDVLTQVSVLIALRITGPQDRRAIEEWIKFHGDGSERDQVLSSLGSLPIGTAWFWSPGWLQILKRVRVRELKTFDSSATPKVGAKRVVPQRLAPVDIAELRARIAETIERAEAEDPKALRARIATLSRKLSERGVRPPARTYPLPWRVGRHVPRNVYAANDEPIAMLPSAELAARVVAGVNALGAPEPGCEHQREERIGFAPGGKLSHERCTACGKVRYARADGTFWEWQTEVSAEDEPPAAAQPAARLKPDVHQHQPRGERAVLTAIAQYAAGVTREQLSILTGYKVRSRDTYIQRLRARGLVEHAGDRVIATAAGRRELGPDFQPLPTGSALRAYWLARLPAGERKVLEAVIATHPRAITRDELSARTVYKVRSRDTYLMRLRARRLVHVDRSGVRAASELFDA